MIRIILRMIITKVAITPITIIKTIKKLILILIIILILI